MVIVVNYLYNQTANSPISSGNEIMDLPGYDYEEVFSNKEKEAELLARIQNSLERDYSYHSIKITSISEM